MPAKSSGFTLIQMSILVLVLSLLGVAAIQVHKLFQKRDYLDRVFRFTPALSVPNTGRIGEIQQALYAFVSAKDSAGNFLHPYLPCPANPSLPPDHPEYGLSIYSNYMGQDIPGGHCSHQLLAYNSAGISSFGQPASGTPLAGWRDCGSIAGMVSLSTWDGVIPAMASGRRMVCMGAVPVRTLGLPDDYMFNPKGFNLLYVVTDNLTNGGEAGTGIPLAPWVAPANVLRPTISTGGMDLTKGEIDVRQPPPGTTATTPANTILATPSYSQPAGPTANKALYVIIDPGKSGNGAWINGTKRPCDPTNVLEMKNNCAANFDPAWFYGGHPRQPPATATPAQRIKMMTGQGSMLYSER